MSIQTQTPSITTPEEFNINRALRVIFQGVTSVHQVVGGTTFYFYSGLDGRFKNGFGNWKKGTLRSEG